MRIREEIGAENDEDFVNVLFMIGNIHKMRDNEDEAQRCWTEAYKIFQDLGLAEHNPKIAEVMDSLIKDPSARPEEAPEAYQDDGMRPKQSRGVFGRLTAKVKGSTTRRQDRGQQL